VTNAKEIVFCDLYNCTSCAFTNFKMSTELYTLKFSCEKLKLPFFANCNRNKTKCNTTTLLTGAASDFYSGE